uniref:Uncharacterized protein n=1 Tax=Solanum lycopersicum TaxID=4081 RepID=A0A3Q7EEB1_SOLLC
MSTDDFTPSTCYREGLGVEDTDIHEFDSYTKDLSFHDQEDITSIGEQGGTTEFDILPVRTRTVTRLLQEKSLLSEVNEDLNLSTILQAKTKKCVPECFMRLW